MNYYNENDHNASVWLRELVATGLIPKGEVDERSIIHEPMTITFFVPGIPKGQPRPRAFARKVGNKFIARVYDAGTAEAWKSQIAAAAKPFIPERPIESPIRLELLFVFPRPKAHYRRGTRSAQLRPDAPVWHASKPDRDNAEKAVMDCLTMLGFWSDDAQICCGEVEKRYGEMIGCHIDITPT